jgi:hypothetical protein
VQELPEHEELRKRRRRLASRLRRDDPLRHARRHERQDHWMVARLMHKKELVEERLLEADKQLRLGRPVIACDAADWPAVRQRSRCAARGRGASR